jgi:acyl-CoA dehydrogenase
VDFHIPDETLEMLGRAAHFVEAELFPLEADFLSRPFPELSGVLEEKRRAVKALGLWTPQMAQEYGGMGLSVLEHGLMSEVLGRSPLGHYCFNCQAPDAGNMEILMHYGSPRQKETFLAPLVRGEIRSCFSMTEPESAGSNPVWLNTTAIRDMDEFVIDGLKWFTSAADGAFFAIVMAVTNPQAAPHKRASMIIVPLDTRGVFRVRNIPVMGENGGGYTSHSEIRYTDCRVPVSNLLGPEGEGFAIAQARLGPGRIHHCMRWIGICDRAFELMCSFASRRELAPGDLLGTRQIIQAWIAESRAEIQSARLMVLHAAWMIDTRGVKEAREEISLIKFHVAGVLQRVVDRAIQVHGALGVTDDTVLSWFYRQERAARIYDGPDEVHKVSVAKRILKQYGVKV